MHTFLAQIRDPTNFNTIFDAFIIHTTMILIQAKSGLRIYTFTPLPPVLNYDIDLQYTTILFLNSLVSADKLSLDITL
jgi:hypothetical protein